MLPCVKEISLAGNQPPQWGMHIYIYIHIWILTICNTHLDSPWDHLASSGHKTRGLVESVGIQVEDWSFYIQLQSAFETNMSVKVPTIWTTEEKKHSVLEVVVGFNPFEKYLSNWIISPGRGKNKKYLKPTVLYRQLVLTVEEKLMSNLFSQQFAHLPRYKLH